MDSQHTREKSEYKVGVGAPEIHDEEAARVCFLQPLAELARVVPARLPGGGGVPRLAHHCGAEDVVAADPAADTQCHEYSTKRQGVAGSDYRMHNGTQVQDSALSQEIAWAANNAHAKVDVFTRPYNATTVQSVVWSIQYPAAAA